MKPSGAAPLPAHSCRTGASVGCGGGGGASSTTAHPPRLPRHRAKKSARLIHSQRPGRLLSMIAAVAESMWARLTMCATGRR
ncbi:hypothetical protein J0H58_25410 [bacterium]|nr:hypothetical protein [bacterium]